MQALLVFVFSRGSLQLGLEFEILYCFILLLPHSNRFYLYLVWSGESREGKKCPELRGEGEAGGRNQIPGGCQHIFPPIPSVGQFLGLRMLLWAGQLLWKLQWLSGGAVCRGNQIFCSDLTSGCDYSSCWAPALGGRGRVSAEVNAECLNEAAVMPPRPEEFLSVAGERRRALLLSTAPFSTSFQTHEGFSMGGRRRMAPGCSQGPPDVLAEAASAFQGPLLQVELWSLVCTAWIKGIKRNAGIWAAAVEREV